MSITEVRKRLKAETKRFPNSEYASDIQALLASERELELVSREMFRVFSGRCELVSYQGCHYENRGSKCTTWRNCPLLKKGGKV